MAADRFFLASLIQSIDQRLFNRSCDCFVAFLQWRSAHLPGRTCISWVFPPGILNTIVARLLVAASLVLETFASCTGLLKLSTLKANREAALGLMPSWRCCAAETLTLREPSIVSILQVLQNLSLQKLYEDFRKLYTKFFAHVVLMPLNYASCPVSCVSIWMWECGTVGQANHTIRSGTWFKFRNDQESGSHLLIDWWGQISSLSRHLVALYIMTPKYPNTQHTTWLDCYHMPHH